MTTHGTARHLPREQPLGLPALCVLLVTTLHGVLALGWEAAARRLRSDSGMSTAEYAIGTIAAAAFAAILYTVVTGDSVISGLSKLVQRALSADL